MIPAYAKALLGAYAKKMREALKETQSVIEKCMEILNRMPDGVECDDILDEVADNLYDLQKTHVKPAISAPPRNCDLLSKDEVLEMLKDRSFSKEDTIEWLYAEAKGETK